MVEVEQSPATPASSSLSAVRYQRAGSARTSSTSSASHLTNEPPPVTQAWNEHQSASKSLVSDYDRRVERTPSSISDGNMLYNDYFRYLFSWPLIVVIYFKSICLNICVASSLVI